MDDGDRSPVRDDNDANIGADDDNTVELMKKQYRWKLIALDKSLINLFLKHMKTDSPLFQFLQQIDDFHHPVMSPKSCVQITHRGQGKYIFSLDGKSFASNVSEVKLAYAQFYNLDVDTIATLIF